MLVAFRRWLSATFDQQELGHSVEVEAGFCFSLCVVPDTQNEIYEFSNFKITPLVLRAFM